MLHTEVRRETFGEDRQDHMVGNQWQNQAQYPSPDEKGLEVKMNPKRLENQLDLNKNRPTHSVLQRLHTHE